MQKPENKNFDVIVNDIARPEFKGDKQRLIEIVEGLSESIPTSKIPPCFSDPNLESGVCNPQLPLHEGEPYECALAKSCLVAKLLSMNIPINAIHCSKKSYEQVLAESDELFARQESPQYNAVQEQNDRQRVRAHGVSISLQPAVNPFRRDSLRRLVLDIFIRNWTTLGDVKATVLSLRKEAATKVDAVIAQVTALTAQEAHGYRIVESFGRYKCFKR
jgi:hypothetical protein